jgi:hypothetical protein
MFKLRDSSLFMRAVATPMFMVKISSVSRVRAGSVLSEGIPEFMSKTGSITELFLLDNESWLQSWQIPVACLLP